jgi:hypothetical protein
LHKRMGERSKSRWNVDKDLPAKLSEVSWTL